MASVRAPLHLSAGMDGRCKSEPLFSDTPVQPSAICYTQEHILCFVKYHQSSEVQSGLKSVPVGQCFSLRD